MTSGHFNGALAFGSKGCLEGLGMVAWTCAVDFPKSIQPHVDLKQGEVDAVGLQQDHAALEERLAGCFQIGDPVS